MRSVCKLENVVEESKYIAAVKTYFDFLTIEFGFKQYKETVNGNVFYDVEYNDNTKSISISYENIDDYLQVIIFILQKGVLPDYDDKTRTLHLSRLNAIAFSTVDKKKLV